MNFLGIGSGLDLSTMLDGLVKVASEPKVQQLGRREIQLEDSLSGLGMLKSSLSDFQSAVDALKDGSLFTKMVPTLSQPDSGDLISVTAGDTAVASNYDIEVVSLAAGSKSMSDWRSVKYQSDIFADKSVAMGKSGMLNFGGLGEVDVLATDSLDDLKTKISALGLEAQITADGRLEYFATGTGETVEVTTNDSDLSLFANTQSFFSDAVLDTAASLGASGQLTISSGLDITINNGDSLEDVEAAINGANAGLTARINLDNELEIFSNDGSAISIDADDAGLFTSTVLSDAGINTRATSTKETNLSGTLLFEADGKSFSIDVDAIDGAKSLDNIVEAINSADDNFGVVANVIDGKIVYQSSISGVGNDLSVTGIAELATTGEVSTVTAASDAEIKVDGVSITNDTNVFDAAVSGLTITAEKVSVAGETASLTVGTSGGEVKSKIEGLAKAYNKLREQMNELKGTTDEEGNFVAGKLTNDPIIRNVESVLNSFITQQIPGVDDGFDTLYAIGLEIESDGTLNTNSDRLNEALGSMDSLKTLFAGSGDVSNNGLADLMTEGLDNFVSFTGVIKGKEDSVQEQLDDLDDQYEAHARYIESYQKTLQQQFTALDSTMARMNSIMQYIGPQLAALPGVAK